MIEKLNTYPIYNRNEYGYLDKNVLIGYDLPQPKEIMNKINEIIDYINSLEDKE